MMTTYPTPTPEKQSRDESNWASPVSRLKVGEVPSGALNLNVDGREVVGPLQGFGQLWQKTYRINFNDVHQPPKEVVRYWKQHLPDLMPKDSRFYPSLSGVQPGEVVLINASLPGIPGGVPVSTGVLVLYADEDMFTVMTPAGHPESGFNTFSAFEEDGVTVAQIQSLARANDPIYEFGFRFLGGSSQQERIWHSVLLALASNFGVSGQVQVQKTCIDSRLQWSHAGNIWQNALVRTVVNTPVRVFNKVLKR
jgi:hypothetical protein